MARSLTPVWPRAPRYGPDEPFPPYAFVPGTGQPRPPEAEHDPAHGFERGIDLYHAGYLWEAHEAWEGVWKAEGRDPVLRGLIQLAASLLQRRMGNERGAAKLAAKARDRLVSRERYRGLDLRAIVAALDRGEAPRLEL